ncbi:MAG: TonB-dependent receptor [Deltaproteobacteria bacterium]|nr:TonB-dependent receptor [Deltaproteobacteria bacterium]
MIIRKIKIFTIFTVLLSLASTVSYAADETTEEKETKLEKTVVTATRTEVSLKDAPGAISVITADEIKDMAVDDVLDIIRETAGVSLIGRGVGGRTVISIRGLESHQTLMMVDGKRIAASDPIFGHSDFEQNWIPIESIERVEVARGPLSSLYGSEAMGGVVNIITKKTTKAWYGSVKAGGGAPQGEGGENRTYSAFIGGPILENKLGFSLSAEYIENDNTPDNDDPMYDELEGKEVFSTVGKLIFSPSANHTIEADINLTSDDRNRRTTSSGRDYQDLYELDKSIYGLTWRGLIGPVNSIVKFYSSDIDKKSDKAYEDGTHTLYPERFTNNVFDFQTSTPFGSNLITLGGEYRNEELESTSLLEGKDDVTHKALFIQDELPLFNSSFLLTPGVRWDDHETFGSEISPRIYALYKLNNSMNLKAGYGHAFRAPTVKQVSPGYYAMTGPHTFLGNPDLQPETSDAYEMGYEYFGEGLFGRVMFFYNDIDDLIAYNQVSASGARRTYIADNIDKAETKGIEIELKKSLSQVMEFNLSYTYLEAKNEETGERLTGKPKNSISAGLKGSWKSLGLNASLRAQYIGNQVYENSEDILEEAPDYTLLHFAISKQLIEGFELQMGIDNITNVRLADKTDLFSYEERGRFVYGNLRYSF